MHKSRILGMLLRPSPLSFTISSLFALVVLLSSNWAYVVNSPILFDYFFGPKGLVTVMQDAPDGLRGITEAIVAGPFTYNVVVLVIAAVVGLVVYAFLEGFDKLAASLSSAWAASHDPNKQFSQSVRLETGVRWSVRIASFASWVIYTAIFAKVVLPYCILASRSGVSEPFTWEGANNNLWAFAVLLVALHVHVILLRLLTLRLRLFGARPELYS